MNYSETRWREIELLDQPQTMRRTLRGPVRPERQLNAHQDLFLNDSLRSVGSSVHGDDSQNSISQDDISIEDEALLGEQVYPRPNIAALYRVLYDYLRYTLAAFFFVYSFVLLFSEQGQCYNGSGSLKKLPRVSKAALT